MDKERALKLARKLAAINGTNATENEAMMAADHLARIAAEHGLTRMDWSEEQVRSNIKSERCSPGTEGREKITDFGANLGNRVALVFGVKAILVSREWFDFIGDETNVTLVKFFLEELMPNVPKIRGSARGKAQRSGNYDVATWKISWETGFIDAICERLKKLKDGLTDEQEARCRALVLVTNQMIDTEVAKKYPRLKSMNIKTAPINQDFYLQGKRDGERTKLQTGIA